MRTRSLLITAIVVSALAAGAVAWGAGYPTGPGAVARVAGDGTACATASCGDNAAARSATLAQLNNPVGVAVDAAGNAYVGDRNDNKVRKITPAGAISTIAGNGNACGVPTGTCGDSAAAGSATSAQLNQPGFLAVDGPGNIYVIDGADQKVRKVTPAGAISTIAGDGNTCGAPQGACGDSVAAGSATSAQLNIPRGIALDGAGNVYIGDSGNNKVRKVTPAGAISTIAGDGNACGAPTGTCGDSTAAGSATSAQLNFPVGLAVDAAGNVYIGDRNDHKVRKVTPAGAISTVAGSGTPCAAPTGSCGDGTPAGSATGAFLNEPFGVTLDAPGNLYIGDTLDNKIRKVAPSGAISTVAGTGGACGNPPFCGDGGAGPAAQLNGPQQLALDPDGNLMIADRSDNEIRWLTGASPAGPNGTPGAAGPLGPQGATGATGATGARGATGVTGATGATGGVGPAGANGPAGPQGPAGLTGATGATGAQGAAGAIGPAGPQGPAGVDGTAGAAGAAGLAGPAGPRGPAGAIGAPGFHGPRGRVGRVHCVRKRGSSALACTALP